ncbi:hypothetical protein H257_01723 [Aphanomyces astaci]|uniref:FYVE-type domain-containing protein n=1 Tax=Aphanomyces astaci TaxID=112090 RepID=W4H5Q0_APHAT|nr:hypothetical protein H257_01723 [Aphanomyces astaci]ETV86569.1 hypothetical protein H257_01723 [Aphanomyces astaci]RQM26156.1 hypothetical protein B5M09_006997 [Aphanomyces astaci]|eukprot:XP_009823368.1 hypothetical protein H257_01723 [Aphanomyces astaci]
MIHHHHDMDHVKKRWPQFDFRQLPPHITHTAMRPSPANSTTAPTTSNQDVLVVDQLVHADDWVCDYERSLCHVCTRNFSTFRRKHHCRMCGEVVCRNCTLYKNVNILSIGTTKVRVCLSCIVMVSGAQKLGSPLASATNVTMVSDEASRNWLSNHLTSPAARSETEYYDYSATNQLDYELDYNWDNPWPRAPIAANEPDRLRALASLRILDTPPSSVFDNICDLVSKRLNCPMAAVSFIDADRQWFKASVGLAQTSIPRNVAFCAHAIVSKEPLVVMDTAADVRFCHNPLVTGAACVRFYASAPICDARTGLVVGTVLVLDTAPRDACDASVLEKLANVAMEHLVLKEDRVEKYAARRSSSDATRSTRGSSISTDSLRTAVTSHSSQKHPTSQNHHHQLVVADNQDATDMVSSSNNLENLLMNLLSQTTLTQQQLATQQISMSQTLGVHAEQIEKLTCDFARMEAKINAQLLRQ